MYQIITAKNGKKMKKTNGNTCFFIPTWGLTKMINSTPKKINKDFLKIKNNRKDKG